MSVWRSGSRLRAALGSAIPVGLMLVVAILWWGLPAGPRACWQCNTQVFTLHAAADGQTLAIGGPDGGLTIHDVGTGRVTANVSPTEFSDLTTGKGLEWLRRWRPAYPQHGDGVFGPLTDTWAVSADGKIFVTDPQPNPAGDPNPPRPRLWNLETGKEIPCPLLMKDQTFIQVLPNGLIVAIEETTSATTIWDLATQTKRLTLAEDLLGPPLFSADGNRCVCRRPDTIELWDVTAASLLASIPNQATPLQPDHLSPDGSRLLTTTDNDGTQFIWDTSARPPVKAALTVESYFGPAGFYGPHGLGGLPGRPTVLFSPDSRWLGVNGGVLNLETLERRDFDLGYAPPVFAPDSRTCVYRSWEATPLPWYDRVRDWFLGVPPLPVAQFGGSNPFALSAGSVSLWDLVAMRKLRTFDACQAYAFFPDGRALAVAHADGSVEIWDVDPRRPEWIEWGLPALFGLLLAVAICHGVRLVRAT